MCTMCGLILESNMLNEYAHMRGSAEGNNPRTEKSVQQQPATPLELPTTIFYGNAVVGTQNVQFINSKGGRGASATARR